MQVNAKLSFAARCGAGLFGLLVACSQWAHAAPAALPAPDYKIATANEKGTYFAIGSDLAKLVAPPAGIQLQAVPTAGSAANVKMLRYEPGVKFAVVQADVFQAFVDRGRTAEARDAREIIRPLRVILPLYNTEIHYIVRADSPLQFIHDIKDAKINGGVVGSGAAVIADSLYKMMFNQSMPDANVSFLSNEEALVKLVSDKTVDVVVVAAGQPAPLISNMKPEAQKFIRLLKFDPNHPASKTALTVYSPATMRAASYPNLLTADFTTVSVGAFLVTYDYNTQGTVHHMARFARSLCENFSKLQTEGHPKWREVNLSLPPLNEGWTYYSVTSKAINDCMEGKPASIPVAPKAATAPRAAPKRNCTREDRLLGLCR
jgi:uncharacterized protein